MNGDEFCGSIGDLIFFFKKIWTDRLEFRHVTSGKYCDKIGKVFQNYQSFKSKMNYQIAQALCGNVTENVTSK